MVLVLVFGVAVYSAVPALEMLVAKEWRGREKKMAIEGKPGKDGEDRAGKRKEGSTQSRKRKIKGKRDRRQNETEWNWKPQQTGARLMASHLRVHHCAVPALKRRQNQKHKQVDRLTCRRKNKNRSRSTNPHTHACARLTPHIRTHSLNEQSSCVQWSWERQHCLVRLPPPR